MRILVVLSFYAPHWTGLTQYARRAAEGWAAAGHTVTVVCSQHHPALPRLDTIAGVAIIRCPVAAHLSRAALAPSLLPTVRRAVRSADVVVMHTPLPEAAAVSWLCRAAHIPFVCVHHGDVVLPAGVPHAVYSRLMRASARAAYRHAAGLVTHSADYADHADWLTPVRWRVAIISPPVDMTPTTSRAAARAALGIAADAFVVGLAGRFVHEKGFDRVFAHCEALHTAFPTLRIIHAGATRLAYEPDVGAFPQAVQSYGIINDAARLALFYQCCDVLLVPSRTDCFPSVAIEALRCGTPILVHDTPGLRSIVWQAGAGRVIDFDDPRALLHALQTLPAAPDVTTMAQRFDAAQSIQLMEALLARVVATHRARTAVDPVVAQHLANEVDMAYRRRAQWLVHALEVAPARRILDCGCGQGAYVQLLRQLSPAVVVGIDRDLFRLRQAAPQPVAAADITALPFAAGTFDRVLLSEVLEHLDDDVGALQALGRIMTPDGLLAISVPCARFPFWWDPLSALRAWLGMAPIRQHPWIATIWSNHVRLYTPAHLRSVIEAAGYEVVTIEQQTRATLPFAHFIVYSIGKPLLDNDWLPVHWRGYADRRLGSANDGRWWQPFNLVRAGFRFFDRPNDRGIDQTGPAVTIVALARRCQADAPA